jgi:hypothetical protein
MRHKDKGRLPPFVPLLKDTLDSPAWRAMSHGAQALYIALKRRYNMQAHNNGRLYLSRRKAVEEIRSSEEQITRWFRELQYYGFIVMMSRAYLGISGKGQAPRWRLTEIGYMKEPPTRDFMRWKGIRFNKHHPGGDHLKPQLKTESRCGKPDRGGAENRTTSGAENRTTLGNKWCGKLDQVAARGGAENRTKSRLTTGWCVGGATTEEEATDLAFPKPRRVVP